MGRILQQKETGKKCLLNSKELSTSNNIQILFLTTTTKKEPKL